LGEIIKYKNFFRKSSFKKDSQNAKIFINLIYKYQPKNFLEVGVLEGVTAKNVCDLLYKIYGNDFKYFGIDLFGLDLENNNIKEFTPISNKYSNPLKFFYHKFILRKEPNSIDGVKHLLKKYEASVNLYKGYSQYFLNTIDLSLIDFCFLDGGHSYNTVKEDLLIILQRIKKNSHILIDDYNQPTYGVKKAVDEIKNKYQCQEIGRFILIQK
tara:strand:- start:438 stop:1073 length:636 start_codon:yes stop_codon:yes gene_type:complete